MNRSIRKKVEKVYSKIPEVNCKGLCVDSCTVIGMEHIEYVRLTRVSGQKPFLASDGHCGYLKDGKCTVYDVRPGVCRLFGATSGLPCPFGCQPKEILSVADGKEIVRQIRMISGSGDMYFNATNKEIEKYVEEQLCQIAQGANPISRLWNRIRYTIRTAIQKLSSTLTRTWKKVRSS